MSGRRVLVVDDDDGIRQVTTLTLRKLCGHRVLAVGSGPQALAQAEAFGPELLVLDVNMPGMDGPATLQALRKLPTLVRVPAIFLTARTLPAEVATLRALGAVDVIAKPFDARELCQRMAQVLAPPATAAPAADERPSALVVEDDPGLAYLLRHVIEQQGWRVLAAGDGAAGLRAIEQGDVTTFVLLDAMLPQVSGLVLLERLRGLARWQGVPVVMLTSRADEPSMARALKAGASEYLGKPVDPAELVARLAKLAPPA